MASRRQPQRLLIGLLLSCALAWIPTGCGTVMTLQSPEDAPRVPRIYSGTSAGLAMFFVGLFAGAKSGEGGILVLAIFDVPFSFVADTLVLPYTIWTSFTDGFLIGREEVEEDDSSTPEDKDRQADPQPDEDPQAAVSWS